MEFITYLITEAKVIAAAPVTFAAMIGVIGLMMYLIVRHQFADRMDSMQSRIQLKDDRIADYEAKLQGRSPDEAAAVIDDLKRRLSALEPRTLTADELSAIQDTLRTHITAIEIAHDAASGGTKKLHTQLVHVFQRSGWAVRTSAVMGLGNPPPTGLAVIGDPNGAATKTVAQALRNAGIAHDVQPQAHRHSHLDEPPVQLLVTTPV